MFLGSRTKEEEGSVGVENRGESEPVSLHCCKTPEVEQFMVCLGHGYPSQGFLHSEPIPCIHRAFV